MAFSALLHFSFNFKYFFFVLFNAFKEFFFFQFSVYVYFGFLVLFSLTLFSSLENGKCNENLKWIYMRSKKQNDWLSWPIKCTGKYVCNGTVVNLNTHTQKTSFFFMNLIQCVNAFACKWIFIKISCKKKRIWWYYIDGGDGN